MNLIHKASDSIFCLQSPKLCCLLCAKSKEHQVNWPVLRKHRMWPHWLGSNCFCCCFGCQKVCSVQNQILIRTAIIWGYVWHHKHRFSSAALLQRGPHHCLSPWSHLLYSMPHLSSQLMDPFIVQLFFRILLSLTSYTLLTSPKRATEVNTGVLEIEIMLILQFLLVSGLRANQWPLVCV